eukprot:158793-Chlamydomonas_euryale.AAC.15
MQANTAWGVGTARRGQSQGHFHVARCTVRSKMHAMHSGSKDACDAQWKQRCMRFHDALHERACPANPHLPRLRALRCLKLLVWLSWDVARTASKQRTNMGPGEACPGRLRPAKSRTAHAARCRWATSPALPLH